jgi:hypothetical protein
VHAHVELVAELPGLDDGAGVAWWGLLGIWLSGAMVGWGLTVVEEVEAAVNPQASLEQLGCGLPRGKNPIRGGHDWVWTGS